MFKFRGVLGLLEGGCGTVDEEWPVLAWWVSRCWERDRAACFHELCMNLESVRKAPDVSACSPLALESALPSKTASEVPWPFCAPSLLLPQRCIFPRRCCDRQEEPGPCATGMSCAGSEAASVLGDAGLGGSWGKSAVGHETKMIHVQRCEETRTAFLSVHYFHQQFCSASHWKTTCCLSYLFLVGKATPEALVGEFRGCLCFLVCDMLPEIRCILWALKHLLMSEGKL